MSRNLLSQIPVVMEIKSMILDNKYYKELCPKDLLKPKLLHGSSKTGLEFYWFPNLHYHAPYLTGIHANSFQKNLKYYILKLNVKIWPFQ